MKCDKCKEQMEVMKHTMMDTTVYSCKCGRYAEEVNMTGYTEYYGKELCSEEKSE